MAINVLYTAHATAVGGRVGQETRQAAAAATEG